MCMVSLATMPLLFVLGHFHHLQKISWVARTLGPVPGMHALGRRAHTRDVRALLSMGCTRLGGACSLTHWCVLLDVHPKCAPRLPVLERCACAGDARTLLNMGCAHLEDALSLVRVPWRPRACSSAYTSRCASGLHVPGRRACSWAEDALIREARAPQCMLCIVQTRAPWCAA